MTVRMSTHGALAQSERSLRAEFRRPEHSADPDRDHDLRADQQQRHDGAWPSTTAIASDRSRPFCLLLATAASGRHVRRHAGFRVDQADPRRRRASMGQPDGRRAVRLELLHDHRLPRHARVDRRDLPDHRRGQGDARRSRSPAAGLPDRPERQLRDRRNHGAVLALRRSGVGVHLRRCSISGKRTMAHAEASPPPRDTTGRTASSIRSASISRSGDCCSCFSPARTWSTTSTCRAICGGS